MFGAVTAEESALAHAEKARLLTLGADYPAALVEWREAIRLTPTSANFHNLYGLALQRAGHAAEAQEEFRHALRLKKDFVDAQNNLAYSLWESHDNRQASMEADRALALSLHDPALHLLRGELYLRSIEQISACREFALATPWPQQTALLWEIIENCEGVDRRLAVQAEQLLPRDALTQLTIGRWLIAANQAREAVPFLVNSASSVDLHQEAAISLAEAYLASCEPGKVLDVLSEAEPGYEYERRDLRGSALLALGRDKDAEALFVELVKTFPDSAGAYVAATQVALQESRWQDALKTLNEGLARLPGNWLLLFRRGVVYKLSGHLDEAESDLLEALRRNGEVSLVAAALGDLEVEKGNLADAAALFKKTWEESKLPQFQFAYALALDRMGNSEEAERELREAAEGKRGDAEVHYTLGKMLSRERRFKQAEVELETARQIAPQMAMNLYALAHVYLAQGEAEKASEVMRAFQKARGDRAPSACRPL